MFRRLLNPHVGIGLKHFGKEFHFPVAICRMSSAPPLNEMMKPLAWLLGKWKSVENGKGIYPTIKDFDYGEEIEFFHVGQPNIQFSSSAWDPETNKKSHRECGFLRIQPETSRVAFLCAQNLGIADVEEGEVNGQELQMESHTVGRLTFGKPPAVTKVRRSFKLLPNGYLEQVLDMETTDTPMSRHLQITYQKVE